MGALRQPRIAEPGRKPPAAETRKLDRYGRDPESLSERLRAQTDYAADTGFSPLYHAMLADLPRLVGSLVGVYLITHVLRLTAGQNRKLSCTPISAADLAELCRANVRDIQRQLSEMKERGLIDFKLVKAGGVKYSISLLLSKWRELEDYSVWKRRQIVVIDELEDDETADDEAPAEISKDSVPVYLTKKPQAVRPGRASRAVKVSVGVKELSFQNDSPAVDAAFSAVVTSGRLVVSATFKSGEGEAKGERKANAERHTCREVPANGGITNPPTKRVSHPRAAEVVNLFDPLLQRHGGRLLSPDTAALATACAELGNLPHDVLVHWVMKPGGRGSRAIAGPRAVAAIIRECRLNWEHGEGEYRAERLQLIEKYKRYLTHPTDDEKNDPEWAESIREKIASLERELKG